jgi:hypothetical protein
MLGSSGVVRASENALKNADTHAQGGVSLGGIGTFAKVKKKEVDRRFLGSSDPGHGGVGPVHLGPMANPGRSDRVESRHRTSW